MKKLQALFLAGVVVLTLAACGNGDVDSDNASGSIPSFTVEVTELDANVYPDDYPLIDSHEFKAAYEDLKTANLNSELNGYQDVADIFGVDGAYYKNNDYDLDGQLFKYYGWYADNGTSVLITFKADGSTLKYYAYSSNGV